MQRGGGRHPSMPPQDQYYDEYGAEDDTGADLYGEANDDYDVAAAPPSRVTRSKGRAARLPAPTAPEQLDEGPFKSPSTAVSSTVMQRLQAELKQLKAKLGELEAQAAEKESATGAVESDEVQSIIEECRDESRTFFGLVKGGDKGFLALYSEVPDNEATAKPKVKASAGKWIKMSYPKVDIREMSAEGRSEIKSWYRVHTVNPRNATVKLFWVKNDMDAFSEFAVYPRSTA